MEATPADTRDSYVAQGSETFNADQFDGRIDGRLSLRGPRERK